MISQQQILRLIETREFRQLIARILANGRCRSTLARQTLARPDAVEVAAIGLATQRLCEITYRPAPQSAALILRLLQLQHEDGTFSAATCGDEDGILAATAVALRALVSYQSQCSAFSIPLNQQIEDAIARGLNALANAAAAQLIQQRLNDPACWAIVLWQLGDVAEFRQRVCIDSLLNLLTETGAEIIEDELARYAHAMAA